MIRLDEVTLIEAPVERCFDLSRSVEVHLLSNVHSGEQAVAAGGLTSGLIGLGQQVTWRAKHFGMWQALTSRVTAMEAPGYLQFTMVQGIFNVMQADHFFRDVGGGVTEMRDDFRVAAPLGVLGLVAEWIFLRRYMRMLLLERNAVIKRVAETDAWRAYLPGGGR